MKNIIDELKSIEVNYKTATIDLAEGLSFNMYETIRTVDFYSNSKYLKGNKDSKGRIKPFYNIVNAIVDASVVATDIDTKDIQIVADDPKDFVRSFLLSKDVYNWMKEENFGETLNEIGETRARYGGVLLKKTNIDKKLKVEVVQWQNVIVNPVDIVNGIIIEKHFLSPVEVANKSDVWKNTEELIKEYSRKKGFSLANGKITVYEVHGEFPESYDPETPNGSDYKFKRMVFFVGGEAGGKQLVLWSKEEKENPYKYCPWKKVAKRGLGRGVVEEGFEAQMWTNDSVRKEFEAMELGAKIVFKTNSKKVANNIQGVDNGHIITLDPNEDFNQVNMMSSATPEFRSLAERWFQQYERATSAYDAQRGETPPSGQPYRLQALVQAQSGSTFDYRREDLGLFLQEVFSDWIIPHLIKRFNQKHILSSDFTADELKMIDNNFATAYANNEAKKKILNGEFVSAEAYEMFYKEAIESVKTTGNQRFVEMPDGYFDNINAKVSIITTGEQKNKQAALESMSNILTTVASNPTILQNPALAEIFGRIMELSGAGISPAVINQLSEQQPQQPMEQPQELAPPVPQA